MPACQPNSFWKTGWRWQGGWGWPRGVVDRAEFYPILFEHHAPQLVFINPTFEHHGELVESVPEVLRVVRHADPINRGKPLPVPLDHLIPVRDVLFETPELVDAERRPQLVHGPVVAPVDD